MPRYSDDDKELYIVVIDDLIEGQLEKWASHIQVDHNGRPFSTVEYRGSVFRAAVKAKIVTEISENGTAIDQLNDGLIHSMPSTKVQWYGAALVKEYKKYTEIDPKVSGQ